ncbi:MAG: type II secretion system protein GspG [Planctomycetes bacterium]|nr:type II secretion system protein GspG [Planctomycetota bacterium]
MTTRYAKQHQPRQVRRAFTLIEIIVVVTIIALLAALIAPRLIGKVGWAKESVAKSEVRSIGTAVTMYVTDTGTTLDDSFDLEVLLLPPGEGGGPQGPYLNKAEDLIDPWENLYAIRVPGEVNYDFDVYSIGPDGHAGTDDDISN